MDCHTAKDSDNISGSGTIALIGQPNVGKSVIFQHLTGKHVTISNYPGTTIEITKGNLKDNSEIILIDTPGLVTFPPQTEDEMVTTRLLLNPELKAIVQVGDAKNLKKTLLLTVQLAELGFPMVLALNMMDEADDRGVSFDHDLLGKHLDLPVIPTTAVNEEGLDLLVVELSSAKTPSFRIAYPIEIENCLTEISRHLPDGQLSPRAVGLHFLIRDQIIEEWLREELPTDTYEEVLQHRDTLQLSFTEPIETLIQRTHIRHVENIIPLIRDSEGIVKAGFQFLLSRLSTHPVWGFGILALVMYLLYLFVGVFGAGTLVDILETRLFGELINPWVINLVERMIPLKFFRELFIGDYGLWTMGITYALALILPIVTTFFLGFGIMEDSGYLPRLATLTNRFFSRIGLNGKAILPIVLGLGCVTMATVTTRILETKREKILATLLLALAVPCSAQLGVVMGMLAGVSLTATLIWSVVVLGVLLVVGWIASLLVPGERSELLIELPPLRVPILSNVLVKTSARLEWYIKEVLPFFLVGSFVIFILDQTSVLAWLTRIGEPLVSGWLGLPAEASSAFLMGFMRRDFGATGLFVMQSQGLLDPIQVIVSMVTITLFIPCIAAVLMIGRERGWKVSLGMLVLVMPIAFLTGGMLFRLLTWIGVSL